MTTNDGNRLDEVIPLFFADLDQQLTGVQTSITALSRAVADLRELQQVGLKNLGDMLREQVNANANKIALTATELAALRRIVNQHLAEHAANNPPGWRTL